MDIEEIRFKVKRGQYEMTYHALKRRVERGITTLDIEHVILNGEIIEQYPEDEPFPSCLIFGLTERGRPLHVVCANADVVKIITVYEPHEDEWIDFKRRKKS